MIGQLRGRLDVEVGPPFSGGRQYFGIGTPLGSRHSLGPLPSLLKPASRSVSQMQSFLQQKFSSPGTTEGTAHTNREQRELSVYSLAQSSSVLHSAVQIASSELLWGESEGAAADFGVIMQSRDGQSGAGLTNVTPLLTIALGFRQSRPIWLSAQPPRLSARPPRSEKSEYHAVERRIITNRSSDLAEVARLGYGTWSINQVKPLGPSNYCRRGTAAETFFAMFSIVVQHPGRSAGPSGSARGGLPIRPGGPPLQRGQVRCLDTTADRFV